MEVLKERKKELNRKANVDTIEANSLTLDVGESKTFKIMDVEAKERLKMRFTRLRKRGLSYEIEGEGNNVTVTRVS